MSPADSGSHQATPRQELLPGPSNGQAELPRLRVVPPLPVLRSVRRARRVSAPLPRDSGWPEPRASAPRSPANVPQELPSALPRVDKAW